MCSFCHRVLAHVALFCVENLSSFWQFWAHWIFRSNYISFVFIHSWLVQVILPWNSLSNNFVALNSFKCELFCMVIYFKIFLCKSYREERHLFCPFSGLHWSMELLESRQSLTCDPMDYWVRGILQAIMLEWIHLTISMESESLPAEPHRSLWLH